MKVPVLAIEDFAPTGGRLYVAYIAGGPSIVRVFGAHGEALSAPPLPPIASVDQIVPLGASDVLFRSMTYLDPPGWYRFNAATGASTRTALSETSPASIR